jgi:NAD(P)-dependent dehydrogenase (short-subunit alcohol dehydrogenase family)
LNLPFDGKVAFVTGAASGIGRATALRFAALGAAVAVVDVQSTQGQECAQLIRSTGAAAVFIEADVSRRQEVTNAVQRVVDEFGRLDVAHNNAGIEGEVTTLVESSEENWDRVMSINLKGVWLCMHAQIPVMLKGGGGAIVNTASVAGLAGQVGATAYCAAKHGIIGLTKAAALEYAKAGIRINAVCPGLVHTSMSERLSAGNPGLVDSLAAMSPIGRAGRPSEIAEAVVWLCSDAASYVVGHALTVDGGVLAQ